MAEAFHRRGHHVQKAHGRRAAYAADGSHLSGGMIALMPTVADAKRLALKGGEAAEDLHVTLFFLGDDGSAFEEPARQMILEHLREVLTWAGPGEAVQGNIFGVAHWNGGGDSPSWVWSVGEPMTDDPELAARPGLSDMRGVALEALAMSELHDLPPQHTPWVPHICAAYTDDLTLTRELEKRNGPVTFDRIRVSFGSEDHDIPLVGGGLTASALRREPLPHEESTDFAEHNRQWESAVASSTSRMISVYSAWRVWISEQIKAGIDTPDELASLSLSPDMGVDQAAEILSEAMHDLAQRAGQSLQREAEKQGVEVPEWSLPDDVVTAAVGGRRLLSSVARMSADLMASAVVQSAKRTVTGLFARDATPELIASEVDAALAEAQDSLLNGPVSTAMSTAQTAGRQAVLEAAPPGEYYASEMLDRSTCGPCRAVDGEQFGSLEIAVKAYPVMGYKDCVGPRYGHSCRGMVVAHWTPEETEPVVAAGGVHPFHGTLGDPGYHALHPGNAGKGKRQLPAPRGGMIGSPDHTEEEHYAAVENYVSSSDDINGWLRSRTLPGGSDQADVERDIRALNDLVDIQEPLQEEHTLYRGMGPVDLAVGDVMHDKGFTSVSDEKNIADIFTMRSLFQGGEKGKVITIVAPPGTRALEMYSINPPNGDNESEWLFPPGTQYRITGVTDDGYTAEVVSS